MPKSDAKARRQARKAKRAQAAGTAGDRQRRNSGKTNSTGDGSAPSPKQQQLDRERWRRRLVFGALPVVALLVVYAAWPTYCRAQADDDARKLSLDSADTWLQRAGWLRGDEPSLLIERARVARRLGRLEQANDLLVAAQKAGATDEALAVERLVMLAENGQYRELLGRMDEAIDYVAPGVVYEAMLRGFIFDLEYSAALEMGDRWADLSPLDPRPLILLSQVDRLEDRDFDAERRLTAAGRLDPDNGWVDFEFGTLRLGARQLDEAERSFTAAIAKLEHPEYAELYLARTLRSLEQYDRCGELLEGLADRVESLETAARLINRPPGEATNDLLHEQGLLALDTDRNEDAVKFLTAVIAEKPGDEAARNYRARAYRLLGQTQEAAEDAAVVLKAQEVAARVERLSELIKSQQNSPAEIRELGLLTFDMNNRALGAHWLSRYADDQYAEQGEPADREVLERLVSYFADRDDRQARAQLAKYRRHLAMRKASDSTTPNSITPNTITPNTTTPNDTSSNKTPGGDAVEARAAEARRSVIQAQPSPSPTTSN